MSIKEIVVIESLGVRHRLETDYLLDAERILNQLLNERDRINGARLAIGGRKPQSAKSLWRRIWMRCF